MDGSPLSLRVRAHLAGRLPPATIHWAVRAAGAFAHQLRDADAVPHRNITEAIGRSVGLSPRKLDQLGGVLDLLQTAFDLADNIADREADTRAGRSYARHYQGIPYAALVCLPALLTSTAVQILHEAFPQPSFESAFAGRRLLRILGDMVVGQGLPHRSSRHIDLVSGEQGLLLCLPFWLVARRGSVWKTRLRVVERWAFRFGNTWEYQQICRERPTPAAQRLLVQAVNASRRAWPRFPPFSPGDNLSADSLFPLAVC